MARGCASARTSAGADPGPACYRRGGPLTVTDANVCVGKIQPAHFPAIFGPDGDQPLDADVVRSESSPRWPSEIARATGTARIAAAGGRGLPADRRRQHGERDQAGLGAEGPRRQRASRCSASAAPAASTPAWSPTRWAWRRCSSIPYAGVLSAYGMGLADQTVMSEQAVEMPLGRRRRCRNWRTLADQLAADAEAALAEQGADADRITTARSLHLRYAGTEAALIVASARSATRSSRTSPRRIAPASASPRRSARWWWKRSRSKRLAAGEAVAEDAVAAGARNRRAGRRSTRVRDVHRRRRARRAGVRAHRAAGRRPHRRAGAGPRGQRDHRGRARLDRRGHARWTT